MTAKLRRNPDFVFRNVADECVLVPVAQQAAELEAIYALSEVGGFIWHQLDGEHGFEALVKAIMGEFEVERDQAETDLSEFLAELESVGAVVR